MSELVEPVPLVEYLEADCPVCGGSGKMSVIYWKGVRKAHKSVRCTACKGRKRIPLVRHNRGWAKTETSAWHHYMRSGTGESWGHSVCGAVKTYEGTVAPEYGGDDRCPQCLERLAKYG